MSVNEASDVANVTDVLGALAGLDAASSQRIRGHRSEVAAAAEGSLHSLFDIPDHDEAPRVGRVVRLLAAARAAYVDGAESVTSFYVEQLEEEPDDELLSVELALQLVTDGADGAAGSRSSRAIRSLLRHIDLLVQRPAAATPDDLDALLASGWNVTEIVVLAQIVTFVSYQTRAVHGTRVLQAAQNSQVRAQTADNDAERNVAEQGAAEQTTAPRRAHPHFTMEERAWHAWVEPAGPDTASERQREAYEGSVWPNSPYFRLLAWHPDSLAARTALDRAIFLTRQGLPRGDRELAATVASRVNGCELCASVHARFTATFSKDAETVERLLLEGPETRLAARPQAIVRAAAALTRSPIAFGEHHVQELRAVGLSDADIFDVIQATAFFAWANRLMLSLGAAAAPEGVDAAALEDQRAADERAAKE